MQEEELAKAQWRGAYFIDVQKKAAQHKHESKSDDK